LNGIARDASGYIARSKCVSKDNLLKIIIIPNDTNDRPIPSPGLIKIVKDHILKRSMNTIPYEDIVIQAPRYVEVGIAAEIYPESPEEAVPLENEILKRLEQFFHPLRGGPEQKGWDFGRGCTSRMSAHCCKK
jgi:hypothetical protein